MMQRKLVLLELNEVPARVLQDFVREAPDSALARLLAQGTFADTHTADQGSLSPWITWPTLHRGVPNTLHGLTALGQPLAEVNARFPPIWELLAAGGVSVGVFGSLHSYPLPPRAHDYAFYVPDTFATGPECVPAELSAFQAFNLAMVAKSGRNVSRQVPAAALAFLLRALPLGVRLRTLFKLAAQVAVERLQPWKGHRRRTFQAVIGFDVFLRLLRKRQPRFATFFTNHVASSMHRYWAAAFPQDYVTSDFDERWRARFRREISWSMSQADALVGQLMRFCNDHPETLLAVTSSMGQAARGPRAVKVATQLVVAKADRFLQALGVPPGAWQQHPAMAPDFNCVVDSRHADAFESALASLRVRGRPVAFKARPGGFFSINFGQADLEEAGSLQLGDKPVTVTEVGLANLQIEDSTSPTAYHIPQGILLIYDPLVRQPMRLTTPVPTTHLAPAICKLLGVPVPPYMPANPELRLGA
jgi:hypothetical protein